MTRRARRACALFGLSPGRDAEDHKRRLALARRTARRLDWALQPGQIALLTGPSGVGKTGVLRALADRVSPRTLVIAAPVTSSRPVMDVVRGTIENAVRALAAAGLAEAALLGRPARVLSAGQRARLEIARAIAISRPGDTIIIDEFACALDWPTTRNLAAMLRRWASGHARRVLCATTCDNLLHLLAPDVLVQVRPDSDALITCPHLTPHNPVGALCVEPGTILDYHALAPYHYRAARPATVVRVLRAVDPRERRTVGVLVVSMPTLEGWWRHLAWPGRYRGPDRRAVAARLNAEVRTISRVIVEPRWRALGLGRRLVRAYLDDPLTPATEAPAAMGACCPFFAAAGMVQYRAPPHPREARLADALAAQNGDPWSLLDGRWSPLVRREVRRWAMASRTTRALLGAERASLARAAWAALCSPRIAYARS